MTIENTIVFKKVILEKLKVTDGEWDMREILNIYEYCSI